MFLTTMMNTSSVFSSALQHLHWLNVTRQVKRNKKAKIVIGRHNDVLEVIRAVIVSGIKLERPAGERGNYTPLCPTINAIHRNADSFV